jgi:hypothetical protein
MLDIKVIRGPLHVYKSFLPVERKTADSYGLNILAIFIFISSVNSEPTKIRVKHDTDQEMQLGIL